MRPYLKINKYINKPVKYVSHLQIPFLVLSPRREGEHEVGKEELDSQGNMK